MFCPSPVAPFPLAASEPEGSLPEQGPGAPGALQQQTPKVGERRLRGRWAGGSPGLGPQRLPLPTRSSVCRLSSREKISLQDLSKERRPGGAGGPPIRDEDEGEEGPSGEGLGVWGPESGEEGSEGGSAGAQRQLADPCDLSRFLHCRATPCRIQNPQRGLLPATL